MNNGKILTSSYGSIPHLSTSKLNQQADKKVDIASEGYLTKKKRNKNGIIIVTEKVDGSNVGIYKKDNKLYALSRKGFRCISSPYKHLRLFQDYVDQNIEKYMSLLGNGERICGEWMIKTMGLEYDVPHEPFISFDIFNEENKRILYDDFSNRCASHDIIQAKLLHKGEAISIDDTMNILGNHGFHGCLDKPEGAVWRYEESGKLLIMAKYVREHKIDGIFMDDESKYNSWKDYSIITEY